MDKTKYNIAVDVLALLNAWKRYAGAGLQLAIASQLISTLLLIVQAWFLASIIQQVMFEHAQLAQVTKYLLGLAIIFIGRAVLLWAGEQVAMQAASNVKYQVRQLLYQKIQTLGPSWLSEQRTGSVMTTLSEGVESLEAYYARYLPATRLSVYSPLLLLIAIAINDGLSALVLALTAPLIPFFMILIGKGTEQRNQQQWQQLTRLGAHFLDVMQGLSTLKLFNASRRETKQIELIAEQYRQTTMSVLKIAFLSSFALEFLASVSIAIVAVLIGFRLLWGEIQFLQGFFILLLAPEFYLPLRQLASHYHARMQAVSVAETMLEIVNAELAPHPTQDHLAYSAQTIEFRNIAFQYPDGRQALQAFNLSISAKQTLALVGASGAGKSTVLQLLLGFIQAQQGEIKIGDTELTTIPLEKWHQHLAWLPQHAHVFPMTVFENIRLGLPEKTLVDVKTAAQLAQADEFIEALPQGYETLLGEGGQALSGGQQQRLALARVFLKAAPLVILDEPSAHLDQQTETLIQEALQHLKGHSTVIMIAHRLATIQSADQIAVLEQGKVLALGDHASLLQSCTAYQHLLQVSEQATV